MFSVCLLLSTFVSLIYFTFSFKYKCKGSINIQRMWSKHDILVNNPKSNVLPYCVLIFYISACTVILINFFLTIGKAKS